MDSKLLIGLAAVVCLLLVALLGPHVAPPPIERGELIGGGQFVLEHEGAVLLEEEYTVFFHPVEGYMLLSQGELRAGDEVISLAQQAQYDRDFLPIRYRLTAETSAGPQKISAQTGPTGLAMAVRIGSEFYEAPVVIASNLALLDNNLIGHFAMLLMAIRAEALGREFTAVVPQKLLSLPGRVEGPNTVEFRSGEITHEGKRFDVSLGDTQIVLIEFEGRLAGLLNRTQGTLGYDAGRFPDGIEILGEDVGAVLPEGVTEQEVTFTSAGLTLAATLALPTGEGPFPAALFLHGSGPVDRDGNAPGMPMDAYRQLAHALAEAGIASLRFDKQGTGSSEGDASQASMSDLIDDARAGLVALRARPEIDASRVILIGHSEGAYLGLSLAGEDEELAGLALLAGAARPLDEITRWQIETILRRQGAGEDQIQASLDQEDEYIAFVEESTGEWSDYTLEELQAAISWLSEATAAQLAATPLSLSWLREHYLADSEAAVARVACPVFVLNGDKDMQIPSGEAERLREILEGAGNDDVTIHVVPDLNHLLRYHPEEPSLLFRHISEPIDPRVIELLRQWAVEHLAA